MLHVFFKSFKFLILLSSCIPLIHGLRKRQSEEEIITTTESILTAIKDVAEKVQNEEIKQFAEETAKAVKNEEAEKGKSINEDAVEKVVEDELKEKVKESQEQFKENGEEFVEDLEKFKATRDKEQLQKDLEKFRSVEIPKEDNSTTSTMIPEENEEEAIPEEKIKNGKTSDSSPEGAYAVWNTKGKICLLARFEADFVITYPSKGGEEKADVKVNKTGIAKGTCEHTSKTPLLQISWKKYLFTIMFNKTGEDTWIVTSMELTYDTSDHLFDRATNAGKKTARSQPLSLFETPLSKSFYCPGEEVVKMYVHEKHVVTARLKDIYLQPYGVEDGQFSPAQRCNKVVIDETPYVQDETVPLAVGCTLALITLLVLLGFSFHRAYNAAKVDYNTME